MPHGEGPRRLTLGRDRKLAGVCGGIAEYLDLDPTIVRIGFVLLVLFPVLPGAGAVILYAVLWLIMPAPRDDQPQPPRSEGAGASDRGGFDTRLLVGAALVGAGFLLLAQRGFALFWPGWWLGPIGVIAWPLLLVLLGIAIMAAVTRRG